MSLCIRAQGPNIPSFQKPQSGDFAKTALIEALGMRTGLNYASSDGTALHSLRLLTQFEPSLKSLHKSLNQTASTEQVKTAPLSLTSGCLHKS